KQTNTVDHQLTIRYMKFFLSALLFILLTSCTKQTQATPKSINQNITGNCAVSYQDNSISIVNFKAQQDNKVIKVTFTTLYEKKVVELELLRGLTENNLCSIYKQEVNADSYSAINYSML